MPKRIQRKRTKGWKMPPNTVYVGRPTKWGNPFVVKEATNCGCRSAGECTHHGMSAESAVSLYREFMIESERSRLRPQLHELRGKDLACWCPVIDKNGDYVPCHADVLLELANAATQEEQR